MKKVGMYGLILSVLIGLFGVSAGAVYEQSTLSWLDYSFTVPNSMDTCNYWCVKGLYGGHSEVNGDTITLTAYISPNPITVTVTNLTEVSATYKLYISGSSTSPAYEMKRIINKVSDTGWYVGSIITSTNWYAQCGVRWDNELRDFTWLGNNAPLFDHDNTSVEMVAINGGVIPVAHDYRADILLPRDGFVQSKLNAMSLRLYYHIPYNGVMSDIDIQVHGLKAGSQKVQLHDVTVSADGTEIEGYLIVVGSVPWNVPTELEFWVYDYNDIPYGEYITVTCYDDFLDANADGKDDRSSQDDWTGLDDWDFVVDAGSSTPFPDGGSILDILNWFGTGIANFFSSIGQTFQSLSSFGGQFVEFLGTAFTYIPAPLIAMIGFGIGLMIVLRIFGR